MSSNKKQLIDSILADLTYHKDMLNGKLVTTGNDPVPIRINQVVVFWREHMTDDCRLDKEPDCRLQCATTSFERIDSGPRMTFLPRQR